MYDNYGRPYGDPSTAGPAPDSGAMMRMPNAFELGGQTPGQPSWYRQAFYPTAPFYSTRQDVGYQTRFYSGGLVNGTVNSESIAVVQFDLPCRLIAINGAAFSTAAGNALPVGVSPRDCFLFRLEYTTGDRLVITSRLASTLLGTAERPGELGGTGYTIDQGASVTLGITPLLPDLRIDITLVCLEMRGPRNFIQR
jgi:hypothetical protein